MSIRIIFVSLISAGLTFFISFSGLNEKSSAITLIAFSGLLYGCLFSWFEAGYLLLEKPFEKYRNGIFKIFLEVRLIIFLITFLLETIFNISPLSALNVAYISTCLSACNAVIACARSVLVTDLAIIYIFSNILFTLFYWLNDINLNATGFLIYYSYFIGSTLIIYAFLKNGGSGRRVRKYLFLRTKSFFSNAPVTAIIDYGDKLLLSFMGLNSSVILYTQIRSITSIQKEIIKHLKNYFFHKIYNEYSIKKKKDELHNLNLYNISTLIISFSSIPVVLIFLKYFINLKLAIPIILSILFLIISNLIIAKINSGIAIFLKSKLNNFYSYDIIALILTITFILLFINFNKLAFISYPILIITSARLIFFSAKYFFLRRNIFKECLNK